MTTLPERRDHAFWTALLNNEPGPTRLPRLLRTTVLLFAFALLFRLLVTFILLQARSSIDSFEMGVISDNIAAGRGFVWPFYGTETLPGEPVLRYSFFPPFYPALMAFLKKLTPNHWIPVLQGLQCLVGALTPLIVWRLGTELVRDDIAWLAGWLTALWPPLVCYCADFFPVTVHAVLLPLILLLWIRTIRTDRPWRMVVLVGVGYGLLAYSLPNFLGSLVVMPAGLRLAGLPWRRSLGLSAVALVVAMVVLLPWTVRNAALHHRFVPVATNLGFNLAGAHNDENVSTDNVLCAEDEIRWRIIDRHELETMNEADFDRALLWRGLRHMASRPFKTVELAVQRAVYFWWFNPQMLQYNRVRGLFMLVGMSGIGMLALAGLAASWRMRRMAPWGVIYAAGLWSTLFYMNFATRGRYNLALQPVTLLFAALGATALVVWWRWRRQSQDPRGERPRHDDPGMEFFPAGRAGERAFQRMDDEDGFGGSQVPDR